MTAKQEDFELACLSIICRKGKASEANAIMLNASYRTRVYLVEITERPITDEEWSELKEQTPPEVLNA